MDSLSLAIIAYAYAAGFIFLAGTIAMLIRWVFKSKGPSGTYLGYETLFTYPGQVTRLNALKNILSRILLFSSARDDPFLRYTSLVFHWSLWIIILAHSDLVLMPYFASVGVPESLMEALGAYLGTVLAFLMVGAGIVLLGRRLTNPYIRRISNASDFFSVSLIVAIGISGIVMRVVLPFDFAYVQVSPFFLSLFSFAPLSVPSSAIFMLHFVLTLTLFIYFPLSKLFHPFSFFTNPTIYSIQRKGEVK